MVRRSEEERRGLAAEAWQRKQSGWSHARIARDLGVSPMTVSNLLRRYHGYAGKPGLGGAMDPARRREIAMLGAQAVRGRGAGHRWTPEEARQASRKTRRYRRRRQLDGLDDHAPAVASPTPSLSSSPSS